MTSPKHDDAASPAAGSPRPASPAKAAPAPSSPTRAAPKSAEAGGPRSPARDEPRSPPRRAASPTKARSPSKAQAKPAAEPPADGPADGAKSVAQANSEIASAIEKAKARLAAAEPSRSGDAAPAHGIKRPSEDTDHEARPPPSSGYRRRSDSPAQAHAEPPSSGAYGSHQGHDQAGGYGGPQAGGYGGGNGPAPGGYAGGPPPGMYSSGGPPQGMYGGQQPPMDRRYGPGPSGGPMYGAPMGGGPSGMGGGGGGGDRRSVELVIPPGKAGIVIGRGGDTLRGIERQFNVRVQLEPSGGGSDIQKIATFTGAERDVEEARRAVQDIILGLPRGSNSGYMGGVPPGYGAPPTASFPPVGMAPSYGTTTSIVIQVPTANVGLIIGKGGETIKVLQQRSNARITVAKEHEMEPGSTTRNITLAGTESSIASAQQLITEIIQQQQFQRQVAAYGPPPGGFSSFGQYCEVIMIPAPKVFCPGRASQQQAPTPREHARYGSGLSVAPPRLTLRGETIKAIQNEFMVNLKVDPNTDANGERRIAIYGQPENVTRAKDAVFERAGAGRGGRGDRGGGGGDPYGQQQQQQYSYAFQTPGSYDQTQQQQQQPQGYDYSAYGHYDPNAYGGAPAQAAAQRSPTGHAGGAPGDGQQGMPGGAPGYDASQYPGYDPKAYAEYYAQYAQYYGQNAAPAGGDDK
ncbi:hypothetical protein HK105_201196 [Polyrhizophydium stewartii]|uniref:K Homology domain-containing protein n=1 Tax=Polyrhizophydium stewartii TaxID=2732419 RepID=A0ABR4NJE0_9FUNG